MTGPSSPSTWANTPDRRRRKRSGIWSPAPPRPDQPRPRTYSLRMGRPGECVAARRSYCLSYTTTLVESGWPLADTPFDVTVMVLPSADSVFVPV